MAVLEANNENFDSLTGAEYAAADCYGSFCAACVMLEPIYTAAANGIRFVQVNTGQYPEIAEQFGGMAMPTLLFFRNGELVDQVIGSIGRPDLNRYLAKMLYQ